MRRVSASLWLVGIPAWVWFTVAALAALGGAVLLARDRAVRTSRNRERRRWAALRGWQFTETDNVLPTQWQGGALAYYGDGMARDVVAGSTFTADGRRRVYVYDLDNGGRISAVIAAVQCRRKHPVVIELWLPSVAFVSELAKARALITPDLVDASEEIGADVMVAWIEDGWVLAAAPVNANPSRLERLLRSLGEVADVVDPFEDDEPSDGTAQLPPGRHGQ
jgi:hypothetical protein